MHTHTHTHTYTHIHTHTHFHWSWLDPPLHFNPSPSITHQLFAVDACGRHHCRHNFYFFTFFLSSFSNLHPNIFSCWSQLLRICTCSFNLKKQSNNIVIIDAFSHDNQPYRLRLQPQLTTHRMYWLTGNIRLLSGLPTTSVWLFSGYSQFVHIFTVKPAVRLETQQALTPLPPTQQLSVRRSKVTFTHHTTASLSLHIKGSGSIKTTKANTHTHTHTHKERLMEYHL